MAASPSLGIALAPYHLPQDSHALAELIKTLDHNIEVFYAWEHGMGCMTKLPKEQELMQMRQVVEQQQQALQQMVQAQQMDAKRHETDAFDQEIQGLGPAWQEVFGNGPFNALPPNSPERM